MFSGDVNGDVTPLGGGKVVLVIADPGGEGDKILSGNDIEKYPVFNGWVW